jgi:hypothetical protein
MQPNPVEHDPPFRVEPISPDLLAWARQTLNVPDIVEEIKQIQAGEGCSLESFVAELEHRACGK